MEIGVLVYLLIKVSKEEPAPITVPQAGKKQKPQPQKPKKR